MANVQWSVIRKASGMLLYCDNKLGDARDKADKARNMLEGKQQTMQDVRKRLKRCKKKYKKATIAEKRAGYQAKVNELQVSSDNLVVEVASYAEEFEEKKVRLLELQEERRKKRMEIEKLLRNFETEKWITVMGIDDASAIRMFCDLDKVGKILNFTVGGSLRERGTESICNILQELGLKEVESKRVYELSETGIRTLTNEEKRKLEGGNGKSRRKRKKKAGN